MSAKVNFTNPFFKRKDLSIKNTVLTGRKLHLQKTIDKLNKKLSAAYNEIEVLNQTISDINEETYNNINEEMEVRGCQE